MNTAGLACGFSIVEALIALAILSVGMVGVATLYVESLRASRSAVYRTTAVNLASDIAERIRANRNAGNSGDAYKLNAEDKPSRRHCSRFAAIPCSTAAQAQDDLAQWIAAISSSLPGDGATTPSGTIGVDTETVPTRYTVTVTWLEAGEPQPLSYVLSMRL